MNDHAPASQATARAELTELLGEFRAWFDWAALTGLEDWPVDTASAQAIAPEVAPQATEPHEDRRPAPPPSAPPRTPASARGPGGLSAAAPVVASVLQRVRPSASAAPAESLELVRADVGPACKRCDLHEGRQRIVFGSGSNAPTIMVVGDYPGAVDDDTGEAWIGVEGPLLTRMLRAIGHSRGTVFLTHLVKCRPKHGREPSAAELSACRPFLVRQLRALQPMVVLAAGPLAARALSQRQEPLAALRGLDLTWQGVPLVVTHEPSRLLTTPQLKAEAWDDLRRVRAFANART